MSRIEQVKFYATYIISVSIMAGGIYGLIRLFS